MEQIKVINAPQTVRGGIVALTEKQAASRSHCLKATKKDGEYQVVKPIQFKVGETFEYDGPATTGKTAAEAAVTVKKATVKKAS